MHRGVLLTLPLGLAILGCGGGGGGSTGGGDGSNEAVSSTSLYSDTNSFSAASDDSLELSFALAGTALSGSGVLIEPGNASACTFSATVAGDHSVTGALTLVSGTKIPITGAFDGTTLSLEVVLGGTDLGTVSLSAKNGYRPLVLKETYTGALESTNGSSNCTLTVTSQTPGAYQATLATTYQGTSYTLKTLGSAENANAPSGEIFWTIADTGGNPLGIMRTSTQGAAHWAGSTDFFLGGQELESNPVLHG